jgi:excisionase family DNA binding protein
MTNKTEQQLPPLAYTVREAQQVLRLSKTSIYELIKTGELRTVKRAGRRLIPASAALELLNSASE